MKDKKIDIDQLNKQIFLMTQSNPELLDEFLRDGGYDPEELALKGITKVKAQLFKQKVLLKKKEQESLYAKAKTLFVAAEESTREAILVLLKQRAPRLQFNNLEKLEESDLKDILNETDLLDLMDKISKNEF